MTERENNKAWQAQAEHYQREAIERMENGADAADEVQAHVCAALGLLRMWEPPNRVAAFLRHLADEHERAAKEARRGDH